MRKLFVLVILLSLIFNGCNKPSTEEASHSLLIIGDLRNLGGQSYQDAVNRVLEQIQQHPEYRQIKVLRLGDNTGSAFRANSVSVDMPQPFDCEAELLAEAPMKVRMVKTEKEEYLKQNRSRCDQKQSQYQVKQREQLNQLRTLLLAAPGQRVCLSLSDIGRRLVREMETGKQERTTVVLISTGINTPAGCADKSLDTVSLPDKVRMKIIQLPLLGQNNLHDQRTEKLHTVFPQAETIPAANTERVFSSEAPAMAKR